VGHQKQSVRYACLQLLGGLARKKVRLYGHVTGDTAEEIANRAKEHAYKGVTAIRFRGFHVWDREDIHDHQKTIDQQVEFTAAIREAVGNEVDILAECHGRYDPEWMIQLHTLHRRSDLSRKPRNDVARTRESPSPARRR
jgi:L-alanine-DL-glutamate epimerase-like enolase superfamily enzyme